jgi:hypothetical protein
MENGHDDVKEMVSDHDRFLGGWAEEIRDDLSPCTLTKEGCRTQI